MFSVEVGPSSAKQVPKKIMGGESGTDAGFRGYELKKTRHEDESAVRAPGDAGFAPSCGNGSCS